MKNRILLQVFVLLAAVGSFTSCIDTNKKKEDTIICTYPKVTYNRPNILWLVAEDMSPYLAAYGDSTIYKYTPNLNRLVDEGVTYTRSFSPSGVCAPSRFAIATGMYPSSMGAHNMRTQGTKYFDDLGIISYDVVTPPEVKMMSQVLRENGYYTTNNRKTDYQFKATATAWDESSGAAHYKNRAVGQPFFAVFNFMVTHESRIWTKAQDSLWVPEDLEVPVPPYLPDTEVAINDIRRMYSNIVEMDHMVGEKLNELEEAGLLDNTIIFWYADHGGPLPRQKRLLFDSGMKLPLIIRFPDGAGAGTFDERLVSFIDYAPTVFSLAGVEPPEYLQGQSFLGAYTAPEREYVHGAADRFDGFYDRIRAVRDKRFKYLKNYNLDKPYYLPVVYRTNQPIMRELLRLKDAGELNAVQSQWFENKEPEQLYDTENDPHEINNLPDNPAYAKKLAELRAECERWMEDTDDKGGISEADLISMFWPGWQESGFTKPMTNNPAYTMLDGKLQVTCTTEGSSIGYQIVDSKESTGATWQIYKESITFPEEKEVYLITDRIGYAPSDTIKVVF